ncbi:MAG: ATP-binding protein [Telluria sp.]
MNVLNGTHSLSEGSEIDRLRRTTRDLVAMSALPAIWGDLGIDGVIDSLASVLVSTLDLDLACVRLAGSGDVAALDALRCKPQDNAALFLPAAHDVLDSLAMPGLANQRTTIVHPADGRLLRLHVVHLGIGQGIGALVAASGRPDFPSEHERLLLGVAANQAAVVLQRRQAETALRQSEAKQRALFDEVTKSNKNLSEFLAVLAHELRNPLAPIVTGLEVMRIRADSRETVASMRGIIERQVKQLAHLIDDLLDIARVTNGKVDIKREEVDLKAIVANAVETSLPLIEKGRHAFSLKLPDAPLPVNADPARIAQVIGNLLTNAAKYTPPGGSIELVVGQDGGQAVISVIDSGVGIPRESLESVFDMFSQVGRHMQHSQGGLGIGLSLVRQLVSLHGGTVAASSEGAGKGSTFAVRLPLELAGVPATAGARAAGSVRMPGNTFRILVADDNVDAATTLASLLEMHGHALRVAHDGPEALQMASEFQPEVLFLDIGMPGMTGYEVARRIRTIPGLERSVIAAVSGWGAKEDLVRAKEAGFDMHFTKPVAPGRVADFLGALRQHKDG